ncbi:MAG: cation transporter [Alphaproteobacteria bacterium]|nr:MAG: cation transporter [Alphaproteobacteria bacterium]
MTEKTYAVVGMHCGGCVRKLQAVLEPLADKVTVTLQPPQVVVQGSVPFERLNAAVKGVGSYTLKRPAISKAITVEAPTTGLGWLRTYRPLLLIAGYITAMALIAAFDRSSGRVDGMAFMRVFMAGFFLVFSFFKLLNLRGFADAYAGYDLLAMRWRGYGYVYPFIELGLGLAFALNVMPLAVNALTLVVMGFSTLGVVKALLDRRKIRCACLGTVLNLPMTTVTVVEDLLMVGMAAGMVLMIVGAG